MTSRLDLSPWGITHPAIVRNPVPAILYEEALKHDAASISSAGALMTSSAAKTGRSPKDKRIVNTPESYNDVWWGEVNKELSPTSYEANRQRAIDYLNSQDQVYVIDAFAGWDVEHRIKVRVICARAYHALFMHNMLVRPSVKELENFGTPDYVILNAGEFPADPGNPGLTSNTSIALNFEKRELTILGSQYAGEMKKGVFTIMNYLMPKQGILSMHCSANEGKAGDVSLFFGLSGTGKTTLSTEANRRLIGDDEQCWTDLGIFNIEGGCYAKCIDLSKDSEPEIFNAIRFGTVLENVVSDAETREVDFTDGSITENTRASYPMEFIENVKIPCLGKHPKNIIFLVCDAFGVLPPVSELTPEQAMYYYMSGYTAKVAGTEMGVTEPQPIFSACFGAPFLVWHPSKYAELLAQKMEKHGAKAWLVNTGWSGGPYGIGKRMSIKHTRAIIDAIHSGELCSSPKTTDEFFGLHIPTQATNIPADVLIPQISWNDPEAYQHMAMKLARMFQDNFAKYADIADDKIAEAGPHF